MSIRVENISKTFGAYQALNRVSLEVQTGELVALLGPSGSGKTTLLRIIAGLEFADRDSGHIEIEGREVTAWHARDRQIGFVFQHYALFRHLTVFENIAFGLRVSPRAQRPSEEAIQNKVTELLKLVQISELAQRFPSQLSGGQRQRVALARSLAVEPRVLLLDEPFGALDAKVRKDLRRWLRRLHDEIHVTSLFVTHDQDEALEVADRVVVMNKGHIEQIGTPAEVYDRPANPFVYDFLGNVNLFRGRVESGRVHIGRAEYAMPEHEASKDAPAIAYVRPHDIKIHRQIAGPDFIPASIKLVTPMGSVVRLQLDALDETGAFEVELTREEWTLHKYLVGENVFVELRNLRVFAEDYSI
jgi:sulfate/thiosulfate transport system ATP-binding protein